MIYLHPEARRLHPPPALPETREISGEVVSTLRKDGGGSAAVVVKASSFLNMIYLSAGGPGQRRGGRKGNPETRDESGDGGMWVEIEGCGWRKGGRQTH